MGQVIKLNTQKDSFNSQIAELVNLCNEDLGAINGVILQKLESNVPLIHEIASYLILSGGKRLRPLLTSCSYRLFGKKEKNRVNHIGLAAAVEFIHAATLLHDDVIDESKKKKR